MIIFTAEDPSGTISYNAGSVLIENRVPLVLGRCLVVTVEQFGDNDEEAERSAMRTVNEVMGLLYHDVIYQLMAAIFVGESFALTQKRLFLEDDEPMTSVTITLVDPRQEPPTPEVPADQAFDLSGMLSQVLDAVLSDQVDLPQPASYGIMQLRFVAPTVIHDSRQESHITPTEEI